MASVLHFYHRDDHGKFRANRKTGAPAMAKYDKRAQSEVKKAVKKKKQGKLLIGKSKKKVKSKKQAIAIGLAEARQKVRQSSQEEKESVTMAGAIRSRISRFRNPTRSFSIQRPPILFCPGMHARRGRRGSKNRRVKAPQSPDTSAATFGPCNRPRLRGTWQCPAHNGFVTHGRPVEVLRNATTFTCTAISRSSARSERSFG